MKPFIHSEQQSGAALITSLIFLTILTILGMSSMGTALLESRMAGNSRDRNMAFQAAEVGLRDAELYIKNAGRIIGLTDSDYDTTAACLNPANGGCDAQICKYGLCYNGGTMAVNTNEAAWYTGSMAVWQRDALWANAIQFASSHAGVKSVGHAVATQTQLPININCTQISGNCAYVQPDMLPLVQHQPEYLIEPFQKSVGGARFYYRITVRGYGMRSGTLVQLQEVYSP